MAKPDQRGWGWVGLVQLTIHKLRTWRSTDCLLQYCFRRLKCRALVRNYVHKYYYTLILQICLCSLFHYTVKLKYYFDFSINIHIMGRNISVYQFISVCMAAACEAGHDIAILTWCNMLKTWHWSVNFCLLQEACSGLFNGNNNSIYIALIHRCSERLNGTFEDTYTSATQERMKGETNHS